MAPEKVALELCGACSFGLHHACQRGNTHTTKAGTAIWYPCQCPTCRRVNDMLPSDGSQPLLAFEEYGLAPVPDNAAYAAAAGWSRGKYGARSTKAGPGFHIYKTQAAKNWEDQLFADCVLARVQMGLRPHGRIPGLEHGAHVVVIVYGVRGDAANYLKVLCDGLKRGLGLDDQHFLRVEARRKSAARGVHGVRVEVWPLEPEGGAA